jgi:hypothetical protein
MKPYLFFMTIIFICGFSQCTSKNETSENSKNDILTVNKFKLRKGNTIKDWNCHEIEDNNICIPSTWKTIEQNKVYYFTYLDNNNDNTYFTILRYDVSVDNFDSKKYLKETYLQLVSDTLEKGMSYTVKRLIFKNKESYYCEYYTKIDDISYITYSMIFNQGDFLYDISLKAEKDVDSTNYYDVFQDILYNFRIKGNQFFSEKDSKPSAKCILH